MYGKAEPAVPVSRRLISQDIPENCDGLQKTARIDKQMEDAVHVAVLLAEPVKRCTDSETRKVKRDDST